MTLNVSMILLVLSLVIFQISATKEEAGHKKEKLDPLKHREARDEVDLKERMEYYRNKLKKSNGCIPPYVPPDPQPLPTVPDSFMTDIEIAFQEYDVRTAIYGQEMYNGVSKRGLLNYQFAQMSDDRPDLVAEKIHYDVKKNEALFVKYDTGKNCTAGSLEDLGQELENIFGVVAHSTESGFIGATSILEFGPQFNYSQAEMMPCHGLECDMYETCIFIPESNATLLYSYYWSRKDWYLGNNNQQVPISVEIYGNYIEGHTSKFVMRRYDYFNFMRGVRPSKYALETDPDVYCYGKESELDPPKAADSFYMHSEIITGVDIPVRNPTNNESKDISYRIIFPKTEYYDYTLRINREDFVPFFTTDNERRFENKTSLIQDFNQGLVYMIQPRLRRCEIKKILNITHGDVVINEDGSIFMKSPWNYEDLDEPMQHNGQHWTRGLDAGVWTGIKEEDVKYTYVWYFASPLTHEIVGLDEGETEVRKLMNAVDDETADNIDLPTVDHVPIKMEKYMTNVKSFVPVTYNIYNYESSVPHVHVHDISLCYKASDMRDLAFNIPADAIEKVKHKVENLKYGILLSLAQEGRVSPLRINRIAVTEISGAVQVTFTLLERPDLIGSAEFAGDEYTLKESYDAIKKKLDDSDLYIDVNLGGLIAPEVVEFRAIANTMKDVQRDHEMVQSTQTTSGYAPGDMAALGICMTIIGAFIGVAALRYFNK